MIVTVSLDFLRKKLESVSLRLQKCVQIAGAYVEIWYGVRFNMGPEL
jgi:hypothetical protein